MTLDEIRSLRIIDEELAKTKDGEKKKDEIDTNLIESKTVS